MGSIGVVEIAAQNFYVGVRVEPIFGIITGDDWSDQIDASDEKGSGRPYTPAFLYQVGGVVGYDFSPMIGVQTEVLLSQLGGNYSYSVSGDPRNGESRVTAVQIPLLLRPRYQLDNGAVFAAVGPTMFVFISDIENEVEVGFGDTESETASPDSDVVYGVTGSLGYELPIKARGMLAVDVRYTRTLTKIIDSYKMFYNNFGVGLTFRRIL